MNERIRELAEQAGINIDSFQFSGTPIKYIVDEPSLEEFAELIVRECCDVFVELRTRPADLAVLDVKKHFGVES